MCTIFCLPGRTNFIWLLSAGWNKLQTIDAAGDAIFKSYGVAEGLPSDILLSIREDNRANLWMSTENGISKFIPEEERFENYADGHVSPHVTSAKQHRLYFVGRLAVWYEQRRLAVQSDSIRKSTYVPPLVFSKLLIANERRYCG